jgi:hypothetical protein
MTDRRDEHGDDSLRRLVRLTRDTLASSGEHTESDEVGFVRLREARAARRTGGRRLVWVATALGVLAVAGGGAAGRLARTGPPLTFEIVDGRGAGGDSSASGTRIVFSDGSELAINDGARAAVRDLRPNGGRAFLARGHARAFFVPRPGARWRLDVGPYAVEVGGEVTGTAFDVAWSDDGQTFEMWQRAGSARVTGPLIGNGMALTHGQHLSTHVRDNKIVLDTHSPAPETDHHSR